MFFFSNKWKSQTCCKGVSGAMCCGKIWDSLRVASVVKTKSVLIGHTLNRLKHEVESFWVLPMYIYICISFYFSLFLYIYLYFFSWWNMYFHDFSAFCCDFWTNQSMLILQAASCSTDQWDVWWVFGLGDPRDIRVLIGLENDTQKRTLVLEYLPT
jgi:hypothetical protein